MVANGLSPPRTQLDCLDAGDLAGLDSESQYRSGKVPSLVTAGAGVHVKQSERGISHHFQNMGVTADE
jgi:hypothetical protein